jgi:hypothetical protein
MDAIRIAVVHRDQDQRIDEIDGDPPQCLILAVPPSLL